MFKHALREQLQPIAQKLAQEHIPVLRARAADDRRRGDYRTAQAVDRVIMGWQNLGK